MIILSYVYQPNEEVARISHKPLAGGNRPPVAPNSHAPVAPNSRAPGDSDRDFGRSRPPVAPNSRAPVDSDKVVSENSAPMATYGVLGKIEAKDPNQQLIHIPFGILYLLLQLCCLCLSVCLSLCLLIALSDRFHFCL